MFLPTLGFFCCLQLICCDLEVKFQNINNKLERILDENNKLWKEINHLQEDKKTLQEEVFHLQETVNQLIDVNRGRSPASNDYFIGFTAYATTERYYNQHDTIQFDKTVQNHGDDYNPQTGVFTCTTTGYYFFTVIAASDYVEAFASYLSWNGNIVTSTRAPSDTHGQGTASATILCEAGHVVSARAWFNGVMWSSENERYSSFTGFLIKA